MKEAQSQLKTRGSSRVSAQQVVFELKQKVVVALKKLADRDTCQIGVDELEKMAECLTPDGVSPFLSCILDTDKEQKSAVRKECIRLIGALVNFHEGLMGPHLSKMVASVVKRLKDPDSVVRDACVETMGILAAKLSNHGDESDGVFVMLVKPLFEALGEQNKQVQSGSALCLARVIDNSHDPPVSILQRMLARTIKLLKNPHFMAKPAAIELNRSIILAGGAPSQNILSAAMTSIQEALKNSDWTTRKAASAALGEIASSGGSCLGPFRASCIRYLESCRFDKVKPVRDAVQHALQYWKSLPGSDTPEPSETGSSIKENFYGGDYSDVTSASDVVRKEATLKNVVSDSTKRRAPLSATKACQNYVDSHHPKTDNWHIEISVPKKHNSSLADLQNEESEGSSITKTLERMSADVMSPPDIGCEYVPMDDKQDSSSVSNLVTNNFETKFVTVSHGLLEEGSSFKPRGRNQQFSSEGINSEVQIYSARMRDRRSIDSAVTENSFQTLHGCCSQVASEMACIRKQLLEMENKQSNLMELLQVFSTGVMDNLSILQSKVSGLEHEVDRIGQVLMQDGRRSDSAISRLMKQNQSVSSPRPSTYTPRPSVDIRNRQPSLLSAKNSDIWEGKNFSRSRPINPAKNGTEMWANPTVKTSRNAIGKDMQKRSGQGAQSMGQARKVDSVFAPLSSANSRQSGPESKNCVWQCVKDFLCEGDLESAYEEALCSIDELVLIELIERTGPVLESLSSKTAGDVLSILASYFLEQRFTNSIIPWLQQLVDLSTINGPDYIILSAKTKREFFCAIQEAVNMEFSNPAERRSISQLAMKLRQLWGKNS